MEVHGRPSVMRSLELLAGSFTRPPPAEPGRASDTSSGRAHRYIGGKALAMQVSVTFRQIDATDALKQYAEERLGKIRKYIPDPIAVNVVLSTERHNHRVDVNLQLHNGFTIAGHETSENMYSSIDLVTAKIERQVKRYKDKLREHRIKSPYPPLAASHSIISEEHDRVQAEIAAAREPALAEAAAEPSSAAPANGATQEAPLPVVDKAEKFHATPMSTNEAIMQLNLLHEQFLVYRSDRSGQVNVVYRRDDGTYGLIETSPSA
jgi:putative sigma-54 modulation protein